MSNGENIVKMRKVRYEIAQNEEIKNGWTSRGIESEKFEQEGRRFLLTRTEPEVVCWKSENNVNRFEVLRDEDDVIKWHTWWDNVTQTFVSDITNRRTVINQPRTKYRREYNKNLNRHHSLNINEKFILEN